MPGQDITDYDRFELFNNCEPMHLLISLSENASDIGLTKERVQSAVESRLRGARLYKADPGAPFLHVGVSVTSHAFAINIAYNKALFDPLSARNGLAATWKDGKFGSHGQDANFIVSGLSELLDKFLTKYLRVNESACTESSQQADPVKVARAGPIRREALFTRENGERVSA